MASDHSVLIKNIDNIISCNSSDRHSYFQLRNFLVGKEPTIQSKMWRCIKELKARKETIDSIFLEIEEVQDNIELISINLNKNKDKIYIDEYEIKIDEIKKRKYARKTKSLNNKKSELEFKLKSLFEECDFLSKMFFTLNEKEQLKDQDDPEENIKYWNAKLSQEFNLKLMFGNQDIELIKTILSLDNNCDIKQKINLLIENTIEKMENKNGNKNIES